VRTTPLNATRTLLPAAPPAVSPLEPSLRGANHSVNDTRTLLVAAGSFVSLRASLPRRLPSPPPPLPPPPPRAAPSRCDRRCTEDAREYPIEWLKMSLFVTTIYSNFKALELSNVETRTVARSCLPCVVAFGPYLVWAEALHKHALNNPDGSDWPRV
jgi:hypothetical protein